MNIVVRSADLESDKALIVETLLRHLTPQSNDRRFDWLYRNGPHGPARVWLAMDADQGTIVGVSGAFPRRVSVGGRQKMSWVLGDFCIHEQYRTLGPALQLQRASIAQADRENIAFWYDFPGDNMMAVYHRLQIKPSKKMLRLVKPLRVDRKVGDLIKNPEIARWLSTTGNFLLLLKDRAFQSKHKLTLSLHTGECTQEFSELADKVCGQDGIWIWRSAEYLNWRYLAHPISHYELLTARKDGMLLAYAVFTQNAKDASVVDLFGVEDPDVIVGLVKGLVEILQERDIITVSIKILETHPWLPLLRTCGFWVRGAEPVVVQVSPGISEDRVFEKMNWFIMEGDRDS